MKNNYYQRIEINGDVNNLPKEDDIYFAHSKTSGRLTEYSFHNNQETWIENIDWYLLPVPSPDVIVGLTEEEIEKHFMGEDYPIKTRSHVVGYTHAEVGLIIRSKIEGAKWHRSQLKTVNLKDELVKYEIFCGTDFNDTRELIDKFIRQRQSSE